MGNKETRVAVIGIIVEKSDCVDALNHILTEYSDYIIGRMGLPYSKKKINCITVIIGAEQNVIISLCGKLGRLDGVSSKAAFSNV
jgi:putative iron-only hydrogenase system regulator